MDVAICFWCFSSPPGNVRLLLAHGVPPVHGMLENSMVVGPWQTLTSARTYSSPSGVVTSLWIVTLLTVQSLASLRRLTLPSLESSPQQSSMISLLSPSSSGSPAFLRVWVCGTRCDGLRVGLPHHLFPLLFGVIIHDQWVRIVRPTPPFWLPGRTWSARRLSAAWYGS